MAIDTETQLVLPANTQAWTLQCWASFVIALLILMRGAWMLNQIDPWVRGFMLISCLFTIGSSFTLAKTLRDNRVSAFDTPAWIFFSWASFAVSSIATFTGVYWLPISGWAQGFFVASVFFVIQSSFSLSKTVRDNHEADQRLKGY